MNYYDDVEYLEIYIVENYNRLDYTIDINESIDSKSKRNWESKHWAAFEALHKMSINMLKDPMDVLENLRDDYMSAQSAMLQDFNKDHYEMAIVVINDLIHVLEGRRS